MPRPMRSIPDSPNTSRAVNARQRLATARETYAAVRFTRAIREEGVLMMQFDAAPDLKARLDALGGLIRLRLLILRLIGWPKEPTLRGGKIPYALLGTANRDPAGDIDIEAMVKASTEPEVTPERA